MEGLVRIDEIVYQLEITPDPQINDAGTIGDNVPVFVVEEGRRPIWEPAPGYEGEAEAFVDAPCSPEIWV